MTAAQAIPSPAARDAIAALTRLLAARTAGRRVDESFFRHDWLPLWAELAAGGWTQLADRTDPGADLGLSLLDLTAIAEVWGRRVVPLPFIETLAVRRWLPGCPSATDRLTVAIGANGGALVPFGSSSDRVASGAGTGAVLELPEIMTVDTFAPSLPVSAGGRRADLPYAMRLDLATMTAASAIGAAGASLDEAIAYARQREQFGRPIGAFQAVRHRLADMHVRLELARSAIVWCCADPASATTALGAALHLAHRVTEDAIQVHGGVGYAWESSPHWYLRHLMVARRLTLAAVAPF